MLPYSILRYVERALGRAEADTVRAAAGEPKTLEQMAERGAWCSTDATIAIAERAAAVTGELDVGRRGGEELFRRHQELGIVDVLTAEGSVAAALEQVIAFSSRVSTGRLMEVVEHFERGLLVEGTYQPGVPKPALFCSFALGYWSSVPSLFGAHGYTAEVACQARGDERCLTQVSWTEPTVSATDTAGATGRRDQMLRRYEDLQKMAAELVAAGSVDSVLDLVVQRAGTAVLAPKFLLVVRLGEDDELRVHHRGFRDADSAQRAAHRVLEGHLSESALVVDVASARRTFGKIAALYPKGTSAPGRDERLMSAYAGHAAAALETAAALERARLDRDTAEALLDLASTLATVGPQQDVSRRLADALVAVAHCDLATVWLWEKAEQRLRREAVSSDETANRLPDFVYLDDIEGLAALTASPRPVVVTAEAAKGLLRETMAVTGSRHMAAIPITARGEFLGLVTAGFRRAIDEVDRAHLLDRLAAVADQAATAFDNARLLEHIRHQALHDALTGLPNRPLVEDRANRALGLVSSTTGKVGLLFVDLDRFKNVNDTLGHHAGDALINQVVSRLEKVTRSCDTLARLGGDEFVVLLPEVDDEAAVAAVARRMIESLHAPFVVNGHQLFISASIGAAVAPEHGTDYATLMQHADAAMYNAKEMGRNAFAVHSTDPTDGRHQRLELESALHTAVPNGELAVLYQPQIDLRTMRIAGLEALVRWNHPTHGLIGPETFLPIAEDSGLIVEVDRWVRRTAFAQIRTWLDRGLAPVRIALNISSREVRNPELALQLAEDIHEWGLTPDQVEIEITDRVIMAEADLPEVLRALRETGVRLAIDDFGTGSSVLSRLQRCPIDTLKIDKSFVGEMTDDSPGAIVPALLQMAQTLNLEVIAEGVETAAQAGALRKLGCEMAQGYYFSTPLPAHEVEEWLHPLAATPSKHRRDAVGAHGAHNAVA